MAKHNSEQLPGICILRVELRGGRTPEPAKAAQAQLPDADSWLATSRAI